MISIYICVLCCIENMLNIYIYICTSNLNRLKCVCNLLLECREQRRVTSNLKSKKMHPHTNSSGVRVNKLGK